MQIIQLYIGTDRVDLFDDESVELTQSIKDVRDIGKVFTEFTKRFTVPASPNNNKIFKHYYNYDIVISATSGFDARKKHSATIELNHLPFKKGKIKLDAIELRDNKAYSYKLTFFGNTVSLKDILGEDKLSDINELETNIASGDLFLNFPKYNSSMIYNGIRRNPSGNDFIVPLITHTQRLFYDSTSTVANTGNLHYDASYKRGVKFNELKPAIRVHRIIEEIQNKYSLSFSTDFFNTSNGHYHDLFMWLHRKKGLISSGEGATRYTNQFRNFQASSTGTAGPDVTGNVISQGGERIEVTQAAVDDLSDADITLDKTEGTIAYNLKITRQVGSNDEEVIFSRNDITTADALTINHGSWNGGFIAGDYRVYVEVLEGVTATFDKVEFRYVSQSSGTDVFDEQGSNFIANAEFDFVVNKQIPEMKVIDFLSGLFKMFNLVAYVDDNNDSEIIVKTLDDYYDSTYTSPTPSDVNIYDISKYIDTESISVAPALPFKEIHFKYSDTDTILAKNHQQVNNEDWGGVEYNAQTETNNSLLIDNTIFGEIYKIELPFHHMKYERLIDAGTNSTTDIQCGFFVDDNEDAYFGKPLLFYPVYINASETFSVITNIDSATGNFTAINNVSTSFCTPSNTRFVTNPPSSSEKDSIHFTSFPNEYTGSSDFTDTLFNKFYKSYIQDKFEPINRMTKVTAFLPPRITSKIKMNDRLIINGRQYRINKIKSNLKTGESDIELLND